jgi:hypothetical protein
LEKSEKRRKTGAEIISNSAPEGAFVVFDGIVPCPVEMYQTYFSF